jgi:hypothetical protein
MTSLQTSIKQVDTENGYYVSLGDLRASLVGYNPTSQTFSPCTWATGVPPNLSTTLASAGPILKDMGKTVVSSVRTFRKVQLVVPAGSASASSLSTFGVAGKAGTTSEDYYTGYIELGFDGTGTPARVAKFGR